MNIHKQSKLSRVELVEVEGKREGEKKSFLFEVMALRGVVSVAAGSAAGVSMKREEAEKKI